MILSLMMGVAGWTPAVQQCFGCRLLLVPLVVERTGCAAVRSCLSRCLLMQYQDPQGGGGAVARVCHSAPPSPLPRYRGLVPPPPSPSTPALAHLGDLGWSWSGMVGLEFGRPRCRTVYVMGCRRGRIFFPTRCVHTQKAQDVMEDSKVIGKHQTNF